MVKLSSYIVFVLILISDCIFILQVKLVQHTYSNLFGTFLCNTAKEREQHKIPEKTMSVWKFLSSASNKDKFRNSLYSASEKVSVIYRSF